MDFAKRVYDHNFRLDPIIRSLLDTDFYKFLMLQLIEARFPCHYVSFALTNRTKTVRLADIIDEGELRAQLDYARTLRFTPNELVWLTGQTFYGITGIFKPDFIEFLRGFSLPEYDLSVEDGQFKLSFHGTWAETTLWEIYALSIVNELRYRAIMGSMGRSALDITYARAKVKVYDKLLKLREIDGLNLSDFGTRRRHSFLWQEHCVLTAKEILGAGFTGTSNTFLAMKHGLEPRGTNAHELPMAITALETDDEGVKHAQYRVLELWQDFYPKALHIALPDTYGTTQFLRDAPMFLRDWNGFRPDSKAPVVAGEELINWWMGQGVDPRDRMILFSDGLDVHIDGKGNGSDIATIHNHFKGRVKIGFGFGTNLTNDFLDCHPDGRDVLKPISLVCKVSHADGNGAVKLSDYRSKSTGVISDVTRYRAIFGDAGIFDGDAPNV